MRIINYIIFLIFASQKPKARKKNVIAIKVFNIKRKVICILLYFSKKKIGGDEEDEEEEEKKTRQKIQIKNFKKVSKKKNERGERID